MAHQAVRNGPVASRDRQNNGVIEGVGSFGTDLATLAVLQMRLAACDLRESAEAAAPIVAGLIIFWIIAGASATVGLAGLALWLATILNIQAGIVMMVVALIGLVICGAGAALLARSLSRCLAYFRRSQEELERNLAWIKTTLVHSGR
jgi:type IV secretory pathway VirB2 component (pilin)